jgi:hypothetical protein
MSGKADPADSREHFSGSVRVPGTDGEVDISLVVDLNTPSVSLDFGEELGGASRWAGDSITVRRLVKYDEVHFVTDGLPATGVIMQWKTNLSKVDGSVAGVIIVRPNEARVTGESGFILSRSE